MAKRKQKQRLNVVLKQAWQPLHLIAGLCVIKITFELKSIKKI
jgi:hypothetical protein